MVAIWMEQSAAEALHRRLLPPARPCLTLYDLTSRFFVLLSTRALVFFFFWLHYALQQSLLLLSMSFLSDLLLFTPPASPFTFSFLLAAAKLIGIATHFAASSYESRERWSPRWSGWHTVHPPCFPVCFSQKPKPPERHEWVR